jgi:hypothetical protein
MIFYEGFFFLSISGSVVCIRERFGLGFVSGGPEN